MDAGKSWSSVVQGGRQFRWKISTVTDKVVIMWWSSQPRRSSGLLVDGKQP